MTQSQNQNTAKPLATMEKKVSEAQQSAAIPPAAEAGPARQAPPAQQGDAPAKT